MRRAACLRERASLGGLLADLRDCEHGGVERDGLEGRGVVLVVDLDARAAVAALALLHGAVVHVGGLPEVRDGLRARQRLEVELGRAAVEGARPVAHALVRSSDP